jgi:hypothetical protein
MAPITPVRTLALTVAALTAATLITALASPDPTRLVAPPAPLEPVASTTLVCPPLLGTAGDVSSYLTVWSPPGLPGQSGRGKAAVRPLGGKRGDPPNRAMSKPGDSFNVATARSDTPPLVVRGIAALAPGLTADVLTVSNRLEDRGLSSVACAEPSADAWFVGGASAVGRRSTLFLSNADISPAVLDIDVYDAKGLVDAPAGRGVVVPAAKTRRIAIDALAPGAGRVAVRVRVASGRVSSALRDGQRDGLRPQGSDYVPLAAPPSRSLVIPGLPGGPGARELTILAPGNDDATVKVEVLGREGSFAPQGVDLVTVTAGTIKTVSLTKAVDGEAVSLRLTSDEPITAGAFHRRAERNTYPEFAWTAATPALVGTGGVASSIIGDGWTAVVMIAAPKEPAVVVVRTGIPGGALKEQVVNIPAGAVRVVRLGVSAKFARRGVLVIPREGSGPVHVARIQQYDGAKGTTSTVLPMWSSRVLVNVPQSAPDVSAGLRGGAPS